MSQPKPRRRPTLLQALSGFLPGLAALAIAAPVNHPLRLIPLLLGNALMLAAACHAIGFDPEPSLWRSVQRRGLAYVGVLSLGTVLLFALLAWPLLRLSQGHSPLGEILLGVGLLLTLLALLRLWPVGALIYLWDDAYPAHDRGSAGLTAIRRSLVFSWHLTAQPGAWWRGLPCALVSLLLLLGMLALAGLHRLLPLPLQWLALAGYGLLLALGSLLQAQRTLKLLLGQSPPTPAPETARRRPSRSEPVLTRPAASAVPPPEASEPASTPAAAAPVPAPVRRISTPEQAAALLAAVRQADVETALQLIEDGADPNVRPASGDRDQRPALMLAALLPETRLLRALIAAGADVNQRCGSLTPLLAATRDSWHGRGEAVLTLLSNGADSQACDQDGNTPLHGAARGAEPGVLAMLLDAGAHIDQLNRDGESALVIACRAANWAQAGFLLDRHAKLAPADGVPALVAAAGIAEDDPDGVQLLLKHRAGIHAVDRRRRSALMEAASEGHERIAKVLLEAGIKIQMADQHGCTALMEAARSGAVGIVRLLAEAQADARARDHHGRDALILACQSNRATSEIVRLLLVLGADPRSAGQDGLTALDHAAANGRWDLVAQIDPQASLPASLGRTAGDTAAPDLEQFRQALRQGRWADLAALLQTMPLPPSEETARLYLDLARPGHRQARRWLLAHGQPAEARLAPAEAPAAGRPAPLGRRLFDALLQQLPEAGEAVEDLLDAGASPAGRGLMAQALTRMADTALPDAMLLRWIEAGADIFGGDEHGRSPLHLAARQGRLSLLQALLARGCDPNSRDLQGQTPLFAAVQQGALALPMVRSLILHGADPERIDGHGETALGLALEAADIEPWLNWSGWTLPARPLRASDLAEAAARGAGVAVQRLLELGFAVDSRDPAGATALMHACGAGHLPVVQRLLAAKADPALTANNGMTALATTIRGRREATLRQLLEAGAEVDQRLPGDTTALMLAAALGYPELTEPLLLAGAELGAVDAQGRSALHFAAQFSFETGDSLRAHRLLEQLIRRGAQVDLADKEGMTPLLLLLGAHQPPGTRCDDTHLGALLPVLLEAGASISHADRRGVTALHACAIHALLAPARILLGRGAERGLTDRVGRTAADVAQRLGYVDIAHELGLRHSVSHSVPSVRQTLRQPAEPPAG